MNTRHTANRHRRHTGDQTSRCTAPVLAHEHTPGYDPGRDDEHGNKHGRDHEPSRDGDVADGDGLVGPGLGDQVALLARQARRVLALAADEDQAAIAGGGELAGLLELLGVVDAANAAAVELTVRTRRHGRAERATGLPLEQLLAFRTKTTHPDRRALLAVAEALPGLPHIRTALLAGLLGFAQIRTIVDEARHLSAGQRAQLDAGFADHDRLTRLEPDLLIDEVRATIERLRPDLHETRAVRKAQRRYFHAQPDLEGGIRGSFELAGETGALLLEAIDHAAPAPSAGPNDHTRHAPGHATNDQEQPDTPEGLPGSVDTVVNRSLARRRADGLIHIAQHYLTHSDPTTTWTPNTTDSPGTGSTRNTGGTGGTGGVGSVTADADTATNAAAWDVDVDTDGVTEVDVDAEDVPATGSRPRRRGARPSIRIVADINQLTGNDRAATAARALLATRAGRLRLTPKAIRRLAENAQLQFLLTDHGEILGISRPTSDIPTPLRAAVEARDQGCRFPGCSAPIHWSDLHHVIYRSEQGPTTPDNLVVLCRRHHTAVHQGGWKLTMTPDGTVTTKRGRHRHTTDPPLKRDLLLPHDPSPG